MVIVFHQGQVISQVRQAFPGVRINVTNLIFDENIPREHSSVGGSNPEGDMQTRYADHTAADDIMNNSIMPQSSTAPQATNSDERLV